MILNKDKNILFTTIQESGLDPNLFCSENGIIDEDQYFIITLRDSKICFAIRPYGGSFDTFAVRHSEFKANFPIRDQFIADLIATFSSDLNSVFKAWLANVVKPYLDDIRTPNLWQILEETRNHTKYELGKPEDFNSFSDEEKIKIRLSLHDFRLLVVKNFSPNQEELKSIDGRLKYLSDAIDKHNKFDWKGIAIQTVLSIIITLSLNTEQGNRMWQLFKNVFSSVLYLPP